MCWCVVVLCGEASAFCFFWNEEEEEEEEEEKKMMRNRQKERSQKNFSELMNQLHITHTCEHISSTNKKNIFNLLFEKLKHLFFLLDYSRLQIFPHRETTSVSNAIYRVMCA